MRAIDADKIPYIQAINESLEPTGKFYARREDIDAMPTIEPEPCDDAVSRKEAVGWFEEYKRKSDEMYEAIREELIKAPSVTPKPKTGEWIDDSIFGQLPVIICDQCKAFFPLQFGDSHNFCPNCGADMRGAKDETD